MVFQQITVNYSKNLCTYSHQILIFIILVQCSGAIVARDKDNGCQHGNIKQLRKPRCGNIAFMPCPTARPANFGVGTRFEICLPGFSQHPHKLKLVYDNDLR